MAKAVHGKGRSTQTFGGSKAGGIERRKWPENAAQKVKRIEQKFEKVPKKSAQSALGLAWSGLEL